MKKLATEECKFIKKEDFGTGIYFTVSFAKLFRTFLLQNTSGDLLLNLQIIHSWFTKNHLFPDMVELMRISTVFTAPPYRGTKCDLAKYGNTTK